MQLMEAIWRLILMLESSQEIRDFITGEKQYRGIIMDTIHYMMQSWRKDTGCTRTTFCLCKVIAELLSCFETHKKLQ